MSEEAINSTKNTILIQGLSLFLLLAICFWVYSPIFSFGFVWDDVDYVQNNQWLFQPLKNSIPYFFGQHYFVGNYHPVTMSVYAIINKFAHLNPEFFHKSILYFHLINAILVFILIHFLFGQRFWLSLITASIFGLHPMHVESVAWISSLKDVLFTLHFLLGLIFYIHFKHNSKPIFLIVSFICFLLSCLSKPTAISFPIILLLIDWLMCTTWSKKLLIQKIPFFLVSFLIGIITIKAQGKAIDAVESYNVMDKVMLSSFALLKYIQQFIFPYHLSALNPFPKKDYFPFIFKITPLFVTILLYVLWRFRNYSREITFGILFFIVTIALMLQFISVGMAVVSDRYTYIPYIGLSISCLFFMEKIIRKFQLNHYSNFIYLACLLPIFIFANLSSKRIPVWESNKTLWLDVTKKFPESADAYYNLGTYFFKEKNDQASAFPWYQLALDKNPKHVRSLINLALIYSTQNNYDKALSYFSRAETLDPSFIEIYKNRAYVYSLIGKLDESLADISHYIQAVPNDPLMLLFRAQLYQHKNLFTNALEDLNVAISMDPRNAQCWLHRAEINKSLGNIDQAKADNAKAMELGAKGLVF